MAEGGLATRSLPLASMGDPEKVPRTCTELETIKSGVNWWAGKGWRCWESRRAGAGHGGGLPGRGDGGGKTGGDRLSLLDRKLT